MLFLILLGLFANPLSGDLFAGNGITTYSYTIDNKIIDFGCDSYNDCFELLCIFLSDPTIYLTVVRPNNWNGNCSQLYPDDSRSLGGELDTYNNDKFLDWYTVDNVSEASILLCEFNKNKTITQIEYYSSPCFTK